MQTLQISTKSTAQFLSNSCLKIELKNRSFQYGKVALAIRTQYNQLQFVLFSKNHFFLRQPNASQKM